MKRNILIAGVGLALLSFGAAKLGNVSILHQLQAAWSAVPVLIGIGIVRLALQSFAWKSALQPQGIKATFTRLAGARLASRGIGYLSVLGPLVAEPMRIKLLEARDEAATAATLVDTGVTWFTSGVVGVISYLCALHVMTGGRRIAPVLVMVTAITIGLFFIARPKAVLPGLIQKLGASCPAWLRRAGQLEGSMRECQIRHPRAVRNMFWLGLIAQILVACEAMAVLHAFRIPFHAEMVLALEAANRLVKMAGGWLPGRIGSDESGMAAAFLAFGLPSAAGLALALTRRIRDLLEVLIGLSWMTWTSRSSKNASRSLPNGGCMEPSPALALN
jgi:uncharacterized membrane protein YbhN (UPF0104 family)